MAQLYAIEDTTMTALADSVRGIVGTTRFEEQTIMAPIIKVSKTDNAKSFTERNGGYASNLKRYDTVEIPGANKIVVDVAYATESVSYDYLQVASGRLTTIPSGTTAYGGAGRIQLTFDNTDAITFYFKSDGSNSDYLGYYAECRGYDANDAPIEELQPTIVPVPNDMTIGEMIQSLSNLGIKQDNSLYFNSGTYTTSSDFTIDMGPVFTNPKGTTFFLFTNPYFGSARSSCNIYYDSKTQTATEIVFPWGSSRVSSVSFLNETTLQIKLKANVNNNYGGTDGKRCVFVWMEPNTEAQED